MRDFKIKQLKTQLKNVTKGLKSKYSVYLLSLFSEIEKEIEIQECYQSIERNGE